MNSCLETLPSLSVSIRSSNCLTSPIPIAGLTTGIAWDAFVGGVGTDDLDASVTDDFCATVSCETISPGHANRHAETRIVL
jgi:hypothetical protein